jgi:hypothetical protein
LKSGANKPKQLALKYIAVPLPLLITLLKFTACDKYHLLYDIVR